MIDLKTLRQLIRLMKENELTELDLRDKEEQVTLKRGGGGQVMLAPMSAQPLPAAPPVGPPGSSAAGTPSGQPAEGASGDAGLTPIKSPMVGTFYSAPSPDAEPFVRVGQRVSPDTVVCVIEAMKVFNEIKAETSGTVARVTVKTGEAVEYGQPLFLIQPG